LDFEDLTHRVKAVELRKVHFDRGVGGLMMEMMVRGSMRRSSK